MPHKGKKKGKHKDEDKAAAKKLKQLAKKCCHPDKRTCKDCPLKGL
jgi:hypothetical protein